MRFGVQTLSCTLHEIRFGFGLGKNNNNYYIGTNFAHYNTKLTMFVLTDIIIITCV